MSLVGLLVGNGNHCDYFVGEARATTLSWEDVARHYRAARQGFPLELEVKEYRDKVLQRELVGFELPFELEALDVWGVDSVEPGEWVYMVYTTVSDAAGYDIRCH